MAISLRDDRYCQGMSDLLAPILLAMDGNEVDAFWCFAGLMGDEGMTAGGGGGVESHFFKDQSGMHASLRRLHDVVKDLDYPLFVDIERKGGSNFFFCFSRYSIVACCLS